LSQISINPKKRLSSQKEILKKRGECVPVEAASSPKKL